MPVRHRASVAAALLIAVVSIVEFLPTPPRGSAAVSDDPAVVGRWTAPFDIGIVGIHAIMQPNGKVLFFQQRGATPTGSRASVWDPASGSLDGPSPTAYLQNVDLPDETDLFCAAHSSLPDGRALVVGGRQYAQPNGYGSRLTMLFDPTATQWSSGPVMDRARWYGTTVAMPDGRVMLFSGTEEPQVYVNRPEVFDPSSGQIQLLPTSAEKQLPQYPRMFVMRDGRLITPTPGSRTNIFDPSDSTWASGIANAVTRGGGPMAVLLPGLEKILVAGGGAPGLRSAEILDVSGTTPAWRSTTPMAFGRRYANGVLLADGTVLAVGGGAESLYTGPVLTPELFDPATETWTQMAPQTGPRMYHSTALLLPDGRVVSAGQDEGSLERTAEVFSPPYLFRGPRPTISSAPSAAAYGESLSIQTPDAASITRVALVRPGNATHAVQFDQRYVDLSFTAGDGAITATAPANANIAPPGWYMLFVLNDAGVPSIAAWVRVGAGPLAPPTNQAPVVNAGADKVVSLSGGATLSGSVDDDGLPSPPGATTHEWSMVSGPGTVTFDDPSALDTTASFSSTGRYVLRLSANDSELTGGDEITVDVTDGSAPANAPPSVSAGADVSIVSPAHATLTGTVTDDGQPDPPGTTTSEWTTVSGPGTVTFGSTTSPATTASFSAAGTYVLRLTASDSEASSSDEVTVRVSDGLSARPAVGSDDAEEKASTGTVNLSSSDLELTTDGTTVQVVGIRFPKLAIPRGATITKAYVQFVADAGSTGSVNLTVRAQAADNASTFTTSSRNVSNRPRTSASVTWSPPAWTRGASGAAQQTPDLSGVLQEVVSRPGWAPGNAIVIVVTGTGRRTAASRNGTSGALLRVEYLPA